MAQEKNIGDALLDELVALAPRIADKGLLMEHRTVPAGGALYALVTLTRKTDGGAATRSRGSLVRTQDDLADFIRAVNEAADALAAGVPEAGEGEWERIASRLISPREMDIVKGRRRTPPSLDLDMLERSMGRLIDERFSEMESVMRSLLPTPVRSRARLASRVRGGRQCTME